MKASNFVKELFDQGDTVPWNTSNKDLCTLYGLILTDEINKRKDCFSFGDYLSDEANKKLIQAISDDSLPSVVNAIKYIKKSIRESLKNEVTFLFNEEQERREHENCRPDYNPDSNIRNFI